MKGVTKLIRNLAVGEQIEVHGTARDNIYRIARQSGIKVTVQKFVNGFYVTRILGGVLPKVSAPRVAPVIESVGAIDDLWQPVERPEYDSVTGDNIYYEQHPKLGKRVVRRESRQEGA